MTDDLLALVVAVRCRSYYPPCGKDWTVLNREDPRPGADGLEQLEIAPGRNRTSELRVSRPLLYPTEVPALEEKIPGATLARQSDVAPGLLRHSRVRVRARSKETGSDGISREGLRTSRTERSSLGYRTHLPLRRAGVRTACPNRREQAPGGIPVRNRGRLRRDLALLQLGLRAEVRRGEAASRASRTRGLGGFGETTRAARKVRARGSRPRVGEGTC